MTTLTGDLSSIVGELTPPVDAWVIPSATHIIETGEVRIGSTTLDLDPDDGTFSIDLPDGFYRVRVRYYDPAGERLKTWTSVTFELDGATLDLADAAATTFTASRPAIDHGNVSGAVELNAAYALHEMVLTGPTTITPVGPAGSDMAVRLSGSGALTLAGVSWDTDIAPIPGVFLLTRWATAGWRAAAVAPINPIEVTPTAPTFDNVAPGLTITIPDINGVQYLVDDVPVSPGVFTVTYGGQIVVTAEPESDFYYFPVGATVEWFATYPGFATLATDDFTDTDGTLLKNHVADTGQQWQITGAQECVITGNRATYNVHANSTDHYLILAAGANHTAGVKVSVDYDVSVLNGGNTKPSVSIGVNYSSTALFDNITITMAASATTATITGNGTIAGTLTGHPLTGKLTYEMIGTAVSVKINDVEVATLTRAAGTNLGSRVRLGLGGMNPKADNFYAGAYQP